MAAGGWPLCCRCARLQLLLQFSKPKACASSTLSLAKGFACRSFASPSESPASLAAVQNASSLHTTASASLAPPVLAEQKAVLSPEARANDELPLDLAALRHDLEDYILSNTTSSTTGCSTSISRQSLQRHVTAGRGLGKYLPLLTSERLRVLPMADVLLLLHVYSKLLGCAESSTSPARGEETPDGSNPGRTWAAADGGGSFRSQALLFIARAGDSIVRRPLDFLVHPQLARELLQLLLMPFGCWTS